MRLEKDKVWLDKPATEIHIYNGIIKKVNQDKLGRVHITLE